MCTAGVVLFKLKQIVALQDIAAMVCTGIGVFIAFLGIAVFSSGIKKRIVEKIKVCPKCFQKNNTDRELCRKCKTPLL